MRDLNGIPNVRGEFVLVLLSVMQRIGALLSMSDHYTLSLQRQGAQRKELAACLQGTPLRYNQCGEGMKKAQLAAENATSCALINFPS
ncbi:hypothetical protein GCM10011323_34230 [Pontibacter amylolyticus]|uniref:Uncharacterized protein n=1 Tax=Pontibacter amylolyticus TaxID=1424080 RepID=A0ABQ1WG67_9BACT|nr:hypothetical protein GCM10011323_34230 [Pontibacter amylolyticus]